MRRMSTSVLFVLACGQAIAQQAGKEKVSLFTDDRPVEITLTTDIRNLIFKKEEPEYQKATVALKYPDSTTAITEDIEIKPRGEYRKTNCNMAALMFNFKTPGSPNLSYLKRLKFVGGCGRTPIDEQTVIREYLVYKMYNLFTEMSFRVRLARVKYIDSRGKFKPYTQLAFFIEDVDDLAKRNACREKENVAFHSEQTSREQLTMVGIFQYMIANADWSIPNYHNIKLIVPRKDTLALPYVIPYDFDCSGFVNAHYAVPPAGLNIEHVTERLYRGYPRTIDEIRTVVDMFLEKKEEVLSIINNCPYSYPRDRREMASFIEEFYKGISSTNYLKLHFIENARRN